MIYVAAIERAFPGSLVATASSVDADRGLLLFLRSTQRSREVQVLAPPATVATRPYDASAARVVRTYRVPCGTALDRLPANHDTSASFAFVRSVAEDDDGKGAREDNTQVTAPGDAEVKVRWPIVEIGKDVPASIEERTLLATET
jgi:hypothetical protein